MRITRRITQLQAQKKLAKTRFRQQLEHIAGRKMAEAYTRQLSELAADAVDVTFSQQKNDEKTLEELGENAVSVISGGIVFALLLLAGRVVPAEVRNEEFQASLAAVCSSFIAMLVKTIRLRIRNRRKIRALEAASRGE